MRRNLITLCIFWFVFAWRAPSATVGHKFFFDTSQDNVAGDLGIDEIKKSTTLYMLESGGEAFAARVWLFQHARHTIDIQYYSVSRDVTGRIATDQLVRAANKGVKVRILIDDAANKLQSFDLKLLESHDNIEIRVYNAGLRIGRIDKRLEYLAKNKNRLLRRMHSKTLIVDNIACVMGGRNIADMYSDYNSKYNFRDRDVMMIGKTAASAQQAFDEYWNDTLTVTYAKLLDGDGKFRVADPARFNPLHNFPKKAKKYWPFISERVSHFSETFKANRDSGKVVMSEHVNFVTDKPGKNEDKADRKGGISTDSLSAVLRSAQKTIDIHSPYVILDDSAKKLLSYAIKRGVKIRVLTNSLASTDNLEAFSAYRRDRQTLLDMGIALYEFNPKAVVRYKLMVPDVQKNRRYKAVYGFHAKTFVIDEETSIVASYNFDPRSANYNTECLCIMRSKKIAEQLTKHFEEEISANNAWPVSKKCNPDSKAGIKKRIMVRTRRVIPKKLV
ncbi:MAG: phospholipase D-like domain-containing protein [Bacteroidia bacterium]